MYTEELNRVGRKHVSGFIGVYALDQLPSKNLLQPPPSRFIVNTDTKNLPGEHWIAVSYEIGGVVYAFDPLGTFYPLVLCNYLKGLSCRRVVFNTTMYQNPMLATCGTHCLRWLMSRT